MKIDKQTVHQYRGDMKIEGFDVDRYEVVLIMVDRLAWWKRLYNWVARRPEPTIRLHIPTEHVWFESGTHYRMEWP